jgi:hypothetical protein
MMATPITRRATRPEECALALALPATKQAFLRDLNLGTAKDFARHTVRWEHAQPPDLKDADKWYQLYYADFVPVINNVGIAAETLGVHVAIGLTLSGLRPLLECFTVVTLVTHSVSPQGPVEFDDGLHSIEEIVAEVPQRFGGILDLTVCASIGLAEAIKRQRRDCLVQAPARTVRPKLLLLLYKAAIKKMVAEKKNYLESLLEIKEEFLRRMS